MGKSTPKLEKAVAGDNVGIGFKGTPKLNAPAAGDNIGSSLRSKSPDFIVSEGGTAIPVPKGANGPGPVNSGKGFSFNGGSGGNGLNERVTGVRIMDPTGRYPNGYASYMNKSGQAVNPLTGRTANGKADPWWHIPLK